MKNFLLISSLLICYSSFAQIDVLDLKTKTNYSEKNTYTLKGSNAYLKQMVTYDDPRVFDEEVYYILVIAIADTTLAKQKKTFSIPADTNIIKCSFRVATNWIGSNEPAIHSMAGQIHITNWNNGLITVQADLLVDDAKKKRTYRYAGIREFRMEEVKAP
jgi:hypothetical protein